MSMANALAFYTVFLCVKGKGKKVCHRQQLRGLCGYMLVVLIELYMTCISVSTQHLWSAAHYVPAVLWHFSLAG